MPGAILIGDAGGTLNFAKIKGVHQAIRCGALAGEHIAQTGGGSGFDARWRASEGGRVLEGVRNFKPAFKRGLWLGFLNCARGTPTGGTTSSNPQEPPGRAAPAQAAVKAAAM